MAINVAYCMTINKIIDIREPEKCKTDLMKIHLACMAFIARPLFFFKTWQRPVQARVAATEFNIFSTALVLVDSKHC